MASVNRKTYREKLAAVLTTDYSASVQAVYGYKKKSLVALGNGPFVTVDGAASGRSKNKFAGTFDTKFILNVTHFVLWNDETSGWTEQNCEDRLDLLETKLADSVLAHKSAAQDATVTWDKIDLSGDSVSDVYIEGGKFFWTETFAVEVRIING